MLIWEAARQSAREIRRAHSIGTSGLRDLARVAEAFDATVFVAPLEPDVSGFVVKDEGKSARIYINHQDSPLRQRFTLAHELGHLVERLELAHDDEYSFIDYRGAGEYDLHEFFADEFAGELLMPAEVMLELQNAGVPHVSVAAQLGVSVPAVRKRYQRLATSPHRDNYEEAPLAAH